MIKLKPYLQLMRWHHPVGAVLLAWPGCWGLLLANHNRPPMHLVIIFLLGAWLTRSLGCVLNDYCDRNFDRHVLRTRLRPLAQGLIPMQHVFILLLFLALLCLSLLFFLNERTVYLACGASILILLYPLSKRHFLAPQCILGLAFSWPTLMAYTASIDQLPIAAWLLFLCSTFWCISYDSIYAMQDKEEDRNLSLHSLPLTLGEYDMVGISMSYLMMLACLLLLGKHLEASASYYCWMIISFLFPYQWLKQVKKERNYHQIFLANQWWGALIAIGVVILGFSAPLST